MAELCADGKSSQEVAAELKVAENTVKATLRTVYRKCEISGQGARIKLMMRRKELLGMPVYKGN